MELVLVPLEECGHKGEEMELVLLVDNSCSADEETNHIHEILFVDSRKFQVFV